MGKVKVLAIGFSIFLIACAGSSKHAKPGSEPDGFRGIRWGTEISALGDMEKVEQDQSSNSDLAWYRRKGDTLTIGNAKLETIFYSFWMGNFESVWIDFKGDENFESLKKELFERFGKALETEELIRKMDRWGSKESTMGGHGDEFYAWWGKNAEMSLSYSKDRHKGALSIHSRAIREERKAYERQKEKEKRSKERGF